MTKPLTQPSGKGPGWFKRLCTHPLFPLLTAIIGAVLTFGLPLLYNHFIGPPDPHIVINYMNQEAQGAKMHDPTVVSRIYADDAVVTDAGCQSPATSTVWIGSAQIKGRYSALPSFATLEHVSAQVNWEPNFSWASKANATAETIGVIMPSNASQKPQFIVGHEEWTFASKNGQWRITSFTYNLCIT